MKKKSLTILLASTFIVQSMIVSRHVFATEINDKQSYMVDMQDTNLRQDSRSEEFKISFNDNNLMNIKVNYDTKKILIETKDVGNGYKNDFLQVNIVNSKGKVIFQKCTLEENSFNNSIKEVDMEYGYKVAFVYSNNFNVKVVDNYGVVDPTFVTTDNCGTFNIGEEGIEQVSPNIGVIPDPELKKEINRAYFSNINISDAVERQIISQKKADAIKTLTVNDSIFSFKGFKNLNNLTTFTYLNSIKKDNGNRIKYLNEIGENKSLKWLHIENSNITNLNFIKDNKNLRGIVIRNCNIVDATALENIENISVIDLSGNNLDEKSVEVLKALKKLNPTAYIIW